MSARQEYRDMRKAGGVHRSLATPYKADAFALQHALRVERRARGIKATEIARRLDCHEYTLCKYERGEEVASTAFLCAWAAMLGYVVRFAPAAETGCYQG